MRSLHHSHRCLQSPRLNAMFVTMVYKRPQPAYFLQETIAYRLRWVVTRTENSPRMHSSFIATTNISLAAQSAHKENNTTIATMVLTTNFPHLIAVHAFPSRSQKPSLHRKTNAGGQAGGYLREKIARFFIVQYEPPALRTVRNKAYHSIPDKTARTEQTAMRAPLKNSRSTGNPHFPKPIRSNLGQMCRGPPCFLDITP